MLQKLCYFVIAEKIHRRTQKRQYKGQGLYIFDNTIMISINFNLYKVGTKLPLVIAVIRGAVRSKKLRFSTGLQIEERFWSKTKQQARTSYNNSTQLNNRLSEIKTRIENTFLSLPLNTPENEVKEKLKNASNVLHKDINNGILSNAKEAINLFIKEAKKSSSENTERSKLAAFKNLELYCTSRKLPFDYTIFDNDFTNKFIESMTDLGMNNNTINLHLTNIKGFLKWLIETKGINIVIPKWQKAKSYEVECIALTEKDLNLLRNLDISDNKIQREIRDIFLFQCFTGQRISDILHLQFSTSIKRTETGSFWEMRTKKTGVNLNIPLIAPAVEIIERYQRLNHLPKLSESAINKNIKHIAKRAGITEPIVKTSYLGAKRIEKVIPKHNLISSHTARRTFITTALRNGMPTPLVMEITGHKKTTMLLRYMKIANEDLALALHKVWQ